MRPPREAYVRATVVDTEDVFDLGNVEMIAGIELRPGDAFLDIKHQAQAIMQDALKDISTPTDVELAVAGFIEADIKATWPGRAYFVEVALGERDGWIQIFQPWERP